MKSLVLPVLLLLCPALRAVEIVAHRGASYDAPENTMAATTLAWQQKADAVETDIYLGADGKIIVMHDKTAKRTAGSEKAIDKLTLAEARTLDAGSWKGPQFKGEKIPLLEEQIASIPAGKSLLVEIKVGPEIVPELKRLLAAHGGTPDKITLISFNYESLKEARKQLPQYRTLYLVGYKEADPKKPAAKRQPTFDEIVAQAKAAGLTGLDLQSTWPLTPEHGKKLKAAGLELHVWTVDDVAIAKRWVDIGVKSITTNRPGWLREQLKQ